MSIRLIRPLLVGIAIIAASQTCGAGPPTSYAALPNTMTLVGKAGHGNFSVGSFQVTKVANLAVYSINLPAVPGWVSSSHLVLDGNVAAILAVEFDAEGQKFIVSDHVGNSPTTGLGLVYNVEFTGAVLLINNSLASNTTTPMHMDADLGSYSLRP